MGKIRDLEIRYDRPSVYAGAVLSGKVCFFVKESCKLRNLSIWAEGQTKVTLPGESSNERWLLRNELNLAPYLLQFENRIPQGFHQVPFAVSIPHYLPSSFGDKYGYIYYCCRAILGNGVMKIRKPFTLIGLEDLNWHPYAAMPVTLRELGSKPFWQFGRQSGGVQVLLTLDRSGFVPGECIEVSAEIVNCTKKKLKSSVVQLRQGVLYKASGGGKSKETFQIVADLHRGPIQPGAIDQWEREQLAIPPVPPSFLRGSDNITLKYDLIFAVQDANIQLCVPIIVGSLPFEQENLRRVMKALPWHGEGEGIYGTRPVICPEGIYGTRMEGIYGTRQEGIYGTRQEGIYGTRQEGIYGTRPVICPQPIPIIPPMQQIYGQAIYGNKETIYGFMNDENRCPKATFDTDDEDENNNYGYYNGFKRTEKPLAPKMNQSKMNGRDQEEIYSNKNNCYYYENEPSRFIKIEEVD